MTMKGDNTQVDRTQSRVVEPENIVTIYSYSAEHFYFSISTVYHHDLETEDTIIIRSIWIERKCVISTSYASDTKCFSQ